MLERKKQQLAQEISRLETELLTLRLTTDEIRSKKRLLISLNQRLVEIDRRIWPKNLW